MDNIPRISVKSIMPRIISEAPSKKTRSRVTNGRSLFVEADARGPWTRRFRDLIALHCADLGGHEELSESQKSLVRRAATIETELEKLEGKLADGVAVDIDAYGRSAGQLRRILESLGLQRVARDVTPPPLPARFKSAKEMTNEELAFIAAGKTADEITDDELIAIARERHPQM